MTKFEKQKGMSLLGMLFVIVVVVLLAVLVVKVVPVLGEYRTVSRVVRFAAEGSSESEIRSRYDQQIRLEGVYDGSVSGKDLKITMQSNGATVDFKYTREAHLFGPVYLTFKMEGQESARRY